MSQPSQGIAFALSAFLGALGVDKFYVGAIGLGVIQLVLTLSIIGMLFSVPWAIVSTIVLGIAILTGGMPSSLYPNVNWAPLTQTDKNIMYVVCVILLFGFISNQVYKNNKKDEKYKKDEKK